MTETTTTTRQLTLGVIVRRSALAGVPVAALVIAWLATRDSPTTAPDTIHQSHGAVTAQASAQPVMLTDAQARRIGITYDVVTLTPVEQEIRTVGQVSYDETRVKSVPLKVEGWAEELYANFTGQEIVAGAPLLSIYSPMLVTAQEELLLAKRLEADVAAGTPDARNGASSLLAAARRRLAAWDVPPSDIERIERTGVVERTLTLRSPVSGFVIEKGVLQGQRVMAGEPLYRIADLGTVWVEGEVFERDLAAIRVGQEVRAEIEALPGRTRIGHISYVYPAVNPETRTARVRVQLANPGLRLKPGMYATLYWRSRGALMLSVPRTAVISTGQRHLVFVRRQDGMLEPRVVRLGAATPERVEILDGLARGEIVVKSATFLLDAESNLGTLLGGMGDMPGMDLTPSKKPEAPRAHQNH